ncbi:hypothetical protein AVEN_34545-1 [Araneus ventricosus]|uniref:Uncharacterized protein n=1 Tax=Araneus ventricosus TaxID=182803 RepID=A0A4Y2TD08_ARAVE|nr:hypothetical protein AVEN_34545-1 [Araneus ventricosus]
MNALALPDDNTLIPVSSPNIPVIRVQSESITHPACVLAPSPPQSVPTQPPPLDDDQPPGPLSVYIDHLQDFLNQDPTQEFFQMFSETMATAITDIQNLSFQSASTFTEQSTE